MELLELLNARCKISKDFTDDFQKEVKKSIEDYKCKSYEADHSVHDKHLAKKRYNFPIPYIYSTHESMLSSLFEKPMELVISGKGANDEEKSQKIKSIYKYLWDKLELEEFVNTSAWWFLLVGMVSSYQDFKMEIEREDPMLDSAGNPMMDEMGNPVTTPVYKWNDPVVYVDDPIKTYFAPDSEYSYDAKKVNFILRERLVEVAEIKKIYDTDVEPDEELKSNAKIKEEQYKSDLKRAKVYYYCGMLPEDVASELEQYQLTWEYGKEYYIVFTGKKILNIEEKSKYSAIAKWFGAPNEFFGYGIGKTLRSVQKEMSIRRGQQIRYADLYAYPWLTIDGQTNIDQVAMQDITKRKPLTFTGKPPFYLIPPEMPKTMVEADNMARSDAQFISGTLDLSKGAQETNTVKTATGQQLFAQSQDKRIEKARKVLARYFRTVIINLFKIARDNWDQDKIISITDEEGQEVEIRVNGNDLADINFDTDIDISLASLTMNENTIAERAIALYDKVKDDPLVDRKKVFKDMLRMGFNKKNPDGYILPEQEEGSQPTNQQTDMLNKSTVGGGGEMMPEEAPPDMTMTEEAGNTPLVGNEMAPNPNEQPYG